MILNKKAPEKSLIEALAKIAPGTELREALDNIIKAKIGGLIVMGDTKNVLEICNGGFKLNCPFTPQQLYELAKMDGAIILDEEVSRILLANVHLVPDSSLYSSETGMRHRTAERVAKQTKALVISISQKRDVVALYLGNIKYVLEELRVILAKANQALQTLEKYKARLDQVLSNLSLLEYEGLATLFDGVVVLQRNQMVERISQEIERYISELGSEGRLIRMQLEELMANVKEEGLMTIKDYCKDQKSPEKIKEDLMNLSSEELLDLTSIGRILGYKGAASVLDQPIPPRGYRILRKIPRLPLPVIEHIVEKFSTLPRLLKASIQELDEVEGVGQVRAKAIQENLKRFREAYLMERYS